MFSSSIYPSIAIDLHPDVIQKNLHKIVVQASFIGILLVSLLHQERHIAEFDLKLMQRFLLGRAYEIRLSGMA